MRAENKQIAEGEPAIEMECLCGFKKVYPLHEVSKYGFVICRNCRDGFASDASVEFADKIRDMYKDRNEVQNI